ncbi:mitochondrial NAD transporter [Auriculariales sp. MPI-PUGE-AT-0066]|nr:mitochondrial NAD transporter [Auriculariales sp. MPI-PUGE-AT-0066]
MPRDDEKQVQQPHAHIPEHKWYASVVSGATAGFVSSVATCPLDVVKTRLQAQRTAIAGEGYLGVYATCRNILLHDGPRGFYRGLGPTLLGYLPTWAIYFSVYDGIKSYFGEAPLGSTPAPRRRQHSILPAPQPKGYQPHFGEGSWTLHILSSVGAGTASTLCTNPFWVIKTRFMTQPFGEPRYTSTLDAFVKVYRNEGWRAFYRGLVPSLFGLTHVIVHFPLYEELKRIAQRDSDQPLNSRTILLCSASAKMVASIATYPHEVVRTRLQIQQRPLLKGEPAKAAAQFYKGTVDTLRMIIIDEGWRGLYKGLSVNLFRTVPSSAVTMLTYELTMRTLAH